MNSLRLLQAMTKRFQLFGDQQKFFNKVYM